MCKLIEERAPLCKKKIDLSRCYLKLFSSPYWRIPVDISSLSEWRAGRYYQIVNLMLCFFSWGLWIFACFNGFADISSHLSSHQSTFDFDYPNSFPYWPYRQCGLGATKQMRFEWCSIKISIQVRHNRTALRQNCWHFYGLNQAAHPRHI